MSDFTYFLIGGLILIIIHSIIPNHWLPIVALSKNYKWSRGFTYFTVIFSSLMHSLSTIIVGILIGIIGIVIFQKYEIISKILPTMIFIIMGTIFISNHIFNFAKHHHHHEKEYHIHHSHIKEISIMFLLIALSTAITIYFLLNNKSLEYILILIGLVILLVSILTALYIASRKHKLYKYSYHQHSPNDKQLHLHSHHDHIHINQDTISVKSESSSSILIVVSISFALFLSPCVEIETYYLQASKYGFLGITSLSLIYTITTVISTVLLVSLGEKLVNKINFKFLEHNEDYIVGIILIILGIFFLFT
ncbi:MAG: hypothetical protein ACP5QP_04205 [Brevinematia bacterium]